MSQPIEHAPGTHGNAFGVTQIHGHGGEDLALVLSTLALALGLSEAVTRDIVQAARAEGVSLAESLTLTVGALQAAGLSLAEALTLATLIVRSEGVGLAEVTTVAATFVQNEAAALGLADARTLDAAIVRAETFALAGSVALAAAFARVESLDLAEDVAVLLEIALDAAEAVALGGAVALEAAIARAEALGLSAASALALAQAARAEALGLGAAAAVELTAFADEAAAATLGGDVAVALEPGEAPATAAWTPVGFRPLPRAPRSRRAAVEAGLALGATLAVRWAPAPPDSAPVAAGDDEDALVALGLL